MHHCNITCTVLYYVQFFILTAVKTLIFGTLKRTIVEPALGLNKLAISGIYNV